MKNFVILLLILVITPREYYTQYLAIGAKAGLNLNTRGNFKINLNAGTNYSLSFFLMPFDKIAFGVTYWKYFSTQNRQNILGIDYITERDYQLEFRYSLSDSNFTSFFIGLGPGIAEVSSFGWDGNGGAFVRNVHAERGFFVKMFLGEMLRVFDHSAVELESFIRYSTFKGSKDVYQLEYVKKEGRFDNLLVGITIGFFLDITPPQL